MPRPPLKRTLKCQDTSPAINSQKPPANLNPFSEPLKSINETIAGLVESEKKLACELQWYDSTDRQKLGEDLRVQLAEAERLNLNLQTIDVEIAANQRDDARLSLRLGTLFNPQNWFAKDQRELRRKRRELVKVGEQRKSEKQEIDKSLKITWQNIKSIEATIQRYDSFDSECQRTELRTFQKQIASRKQESDLIAEQKTRVDQALEPFMHEMHALASRRQTAESKRRRATDLDNQLSTASNSRYERAMIHEQCEREFGEGSPRKVASLQEREIRQLDRDSKKIEERAREIAERASRKIETIVIDGNNLCYEDSQFIGLAALEAVVPMLKRNHSIVVVFDSATRRMLQTNDAGIKSRFGEYATVHIVATRRLADETVLDLASKNAETFILSNDRFSDYKEKPAVRDRRVLRHEIVDGHIFVHDLSIRMSYQ